MACSQGTEMTIDIHDGQPQLSELLNLISSGDEVLIVEGDKHIARLIPVPPSHRPQFGSAKGLFTMAEDFDAPFEDF